MPHPLEIDAPAAEPIITTRRLLDAPRALVWNAFTNPELLPRWMGPRGLTMTVCEVDLRVGGAWRMVHRTPDGQEFAFGGRFLEVVRPERIVRTFFMVGMEAHEAHETLTLEDRGAQTLVHTVTRHQTMAGRDGHLQHGMEQGMTEGYARLDDLLASLTG